MSVRKGVKNTLAVAALTAATVLTTAAPGAAATPAVRAANCPFLSTLCLFDQTGYSGTRLTVSSTTPGGTCVSLVGHGFGGKARSALNTSSFAAALFANDGCVGSPYQVPANGGVTNLGSFRANSVWVR